MSRPSEHPYLDMILANAERVKELEDENERLRTAGNALAEECWSLRTADDAVKAWLEACRE